MIVDILLLMDAVRIYLFSCFKSVMKRGVLCLGAWPWVLLITDARMVRLQHAIILAPVFQANRLSILSFIGL